MKLVDLLSVTNENINVVVIGSNREQLSIYDGKNGIDEQYNNYDVIWISSEYINGKNIVVYMIDYYYDPDIIEQ